MPERTWPVKPYYRAGIGASRLSFVRVRDPADSDALVAGLPSPALVINATGLGKDAAGSPVTGRARFGPGMLAWDLNYRGDLAFLRQAAASGASTLDGWDYFVAGWAGGLTALAQTPFTGDVLARFAQAAARHRPARSRAEPPARSRADLTHPSIHTSSWHPEPWRAATASMEVMGRY